MDHYERDGNNVTCNGRVIAIMGAMDDEKIDEMINRLNGQKETKKENASD